MSGSRVNLEIEMPAHRGGIEDPGALAIQAAAAREGLGRPPMLNGRVVGNDDGIPPQDRGVLADRVGDEVR